MMIAELEAERDSSPVVLNGDGELVVAALQYAAGLKDPVGFVNYNGPPGSSAGTGIN